MSSWVPGADESGFSAHNLPYGIGAVGNDPEPRLVVAIGGHVLVLSWLDTALLDDTLSDAPRVTRSRHLNALMAEGPDAWRALRARLQELLTDPAHRGAVEPALINRNAVTMHLPIEVADYVDFYSSEQHARNLGAIFRPDGEALTPNWKHLPIGYHGRAGTVVVSGTEVVRPCGQRRPPPDAGPDAPPVFGPSVRLDIETEVGFVVGTPSTLGTPVPASAVGDYVFGLVLLNDWSARDIQAWEYVPLGPFLGKSFATSISPWVTPLAALETAMISPVTQDPVPLPYLADAQWGLDLALEVELNGEVVSRPPYRDVYWTPAQQLAHMTVNGATTRTGDLYASGTVSGPKKDQRGSLIELAWNGTEPLTLADGSTRTFLEDGDTVTLRGSAPGPDGSRIELGEVTGTIWPART